LLPQAPQLPASLLVFVQTPPQQVVPVTQGGSASPQATLRPHCNGSAVGQVGAQVTAWPDEQLTHLPLRQSSPLAQQTLPQIPLSLPRGPQS